MSTYKARGRLWFRPKNTKNAPAGFSPVLIAGMIAFMNPTLIEEYEGISDLKNLPAEQLVEVEVTVKVLGRWSAADGGETLLDRCDIRQILTHPAYAHPELYGAIMTKEKE